MELRAMTSSDLSQLDDIDATIESMQYIHVECSGEGLAMQWRLEERPLREKLIQPLRMSDEIRFLAKQFATGGDEGLAPELDAVVVHRFSGRIENFFQADAIGRADVAAVGDGV